jgi:AcrR family transcriptional regulator
MEQRSTARRAYDSPVRRQQREATRERIVVAGSAIAHELPSWDWKGLTFRAVAERAGVSERTVYRHFSGERHLHQAVMRRLEEEAGVRYEGIGLDDLPAVTARVFGSLASFAASAGPAVDDPTFHEEDVRRRDALLAALAPATEGWSEEERHRIAGLLDVLWNLPTFERLVQAWGLPADDATATVSWAIDVLLAAVREGRRP